MPTTEQTWLERHADETLESLIDRDLLVNLSALTLTEPGRIARAVQRLGQGENRIHARVRIADILDRESLVETCAQLANRPDIQDRLIASILESPVYRTFMADMLYRSIRDFLLEENFITQNLPVAGRLVRMGQNFASSTLERLGGDSVDMDSLVTQFLEKRVGIMDRYAETLLKQAMTEKRLRSNGELIWEAIKEQEINLDPEYLNADLPAWRRLAMGLSGAVVDAFLQGWGTKTLNELV